MCEIFSIIGGAVLGAIGVTGASAAVTTGVGVATSAIGGAALGAGVGAAGAAIRGGDIGKGALFGALGGSVLAPIGAGIGGALGGAGIATITSGGLAGTTVATGVGSGIAGGAIGAIAGGIGGTILNNPRASKGMSAATTALNTPVKATEQVARTADSIKDKGLLKRTLSSLRIPLSKSTSNVGLNTGESTITTGLNIA